MGEQTKLEKLLRVSGKATSKGLDALARHGFDLRGKLSAPINRVPRRAPPSEKKQKTDACYGRPRQHLPLASA
jgi:hypothetical protein